MNEDLALAALAALAQKTRLDVYRALVGAGEGGMAAGELAGALGVRQNSLSGHFAILSRAGLISSERRGTTIVYRVATGGTHDLRAFLQRLDGLA